MRRWWGLVWGLALWGGQAGEALAERDRLLSGRLLAACGLLGIGGAYFWPFYVLPGPVHASWFGLALAVALYPTRRRALAALLLALLSMWSWYPNMLFDLNWLPPGWGVNEPVSGPPQPAVP